MRRWLPFAVAAVMAAVALGFGAATLLQPVSGTLLVLASSNRSSRRAASELAVKGPSGWHEVGSTGLVDVPRSPQTRTLAQVPVPVGAYRGIRLGRWRLATPIDIQKQEVTPVLVGISDGRLVQGGVYSGDGGVSLGFAELAGRFPLLPPFHLVDQLSGPFTSASIAGHDTVVAAVSTSRAPTYAPYTRVLAELSQELPPSVLVVQAAVDPVEDTPSTLRVYASDHAAAWRFVTGSPGGLASFWRPFGIQPVEGAAVLAVIDSHGYIRNFYRGAPGGGGWGAAQVVDDLQAIGGLSAPSSNGLGPAPNFSLPALANGRPVRLSSYRGRPVLLNFWASWCVPCRTEMPLIEQAAKSHPRLAVLLIVEHDSRAAAERFASQLGIRSTILFDGDGTVGDRYSIEGLPTTVFIERDGDIESRYIGQTDVAILAAHIAAIGG